MPFPVYRLFLPFHLHYFLLGFFLADIYLTDWRLAPAKSFTWDAVGLLGWLVLLPAKLHREAGLFILPWAILLACLSAFRGRVTNRLMLRPWLMTVGGMCYSIYLYHPLIVSAVGRGLTRLLRGRDSRYWYALGVPTLLLSVFVASSVAFVVFEKPFMRRGWHRRVAHRIASWR